MEAAEPEKHPSQECIRILVVENQATVRSGLRYALLAFNDLELVAEATSQEEALELCALVQPDVILMDLLVPGMDAVELTHSIRQRLPRTQIVALTRFGAESLAQEVVNAGASAAVLKNVSADELTDAIRAAHRHEANQTSQQKDLGPPACAGANPGPHQVLEQGEMLDL